MSIRNWWVEALPDGAARPVKAGTQRVDAGIDVKVWQRDRGADVLAAKLVGWVDGDILTLRIMVDGEEVASCQTRR